MKKKILAAVLAICMTVTMIPTFAFASSGDSARTPAAPANQIGTDSINVPSPSAKRTVSSETGIAAVNDVKYTSLQEAITNANKGDTVTLLADHEENVTITKGITLDLNGFSLYNSLSHDTIVIDCTASAIPATVKNGTVANFMTTPSETMTAIYISYGNAIISNITATMAGANEDEYQGAVIYVESGTTTLDNCEIFFDESITTSEDYIDGIYTDIDANVTLDGCSIETLGGDCIFIDGSAELISCYMAANADYYSAVHLGENACSAKIHSGYYYGDSPLYTKTANAVCEIYEGEFVSAYKSAPVVDGYVEGYANAFEKAAVSGKNIISTPLSNWKSADNALIFSDMAAPASVKSNLTAAKGQTAGYNDIKVTWKAAEGAAADGYRVNYKKGSGSYANSKYYKGSGSRTLTNLSNGYKYTFKVTPYVIINDDILSSGTKCYGSKSKTSYTYTLKKVTLNKFSKSNGKVKVTWKNISGETGYQISKSTKKTGTNIVSTYKTTSGKSKLISATKGKTYYYKVRAYKTVDGKKIYGPWSAAKSYKR